MHEKLLDDAHALITECAAASHRVRDAYELATLVTLLEIGHTTAEIAAGLKSTGDLLAQWSAIYAARGSAVESALARAEQLLPLCRERDK